MGFKEWQTPPAELRKQWERFHFTVDAAASEANALVRGYGDCYCDEGEWCELEDTDSAVGRFYTLETDGLNPDHYHAGDRVWCNPPYDAAIIRWVRLARELSRDAGVLWRFLLPPGTDTRWFHRYIWDARLNRPREGVEVEFPDYRIAFIHPDKPEKKSPRASNLYVTFLPELKP